MNDSNTGLKVLVSFIKRFGLLKGVSLYFKITRGNAGEVSVPGIKYPVALRKGTSDIPAFYQVFLGREYDIAFEETPGIIIDGGANIGLFAILMKNKYPDARIICVEPDPENFAQLKKNTASYKDIICENYGLWNKEARLKVYDKYNSGKWGIVVEESETEGTVPAISLDALLKKYGLEQVDILKLDIETSEKQVFSDNFESWLPKVKVILIELHDWIQKGCSRTFFQAINTCYSNYSFLQKGENVMIVNEDHFNQTAGK